MRTITLTDETKKDILENLLKRSPNHYTSYENTVKDIIEDVKQRGDEAVFFYTEKFDHYKMNIEDFIVTKEEIEEAFSLLKPEYIEVIKKSATNIRSFHEKQVQKSWFETKEDGSILGQKITSIERVGVYVPGGKAAYPSSTLMNIVPAKVAGVQEIIMTTPPNIAGKIDPGTLVAASIAGVDRIYKVGGAQAIAAMAFGTASIKKVHKIVGPGNIFVALAKKSVYGNVSIDSIAGPSEILIIADEDANPKYVAADLLSQAEHDELASAILITTSDKLASEVAAWI